MAEQVLREMPQKSSHSREANHSPEAQQRQTCGQPQCVNISVKCE